MGSPCPPHWSFAARAAYFGDRMCGFCDHRNPADARFCNGCASPLDLKPCKQCDAVNDQAATSCRKCGAACPAPFGTAQAIAMSATDDAAASEAPGDAVASARVTQPFAGSALRAGLRLLTRGRLLLAAIAAILVGIAYQVYRIDVATPVATGVASRPAGAPESPATAATLAMPVAAKSKSLEPEESVVRAVPVPAVNADVPQRAIVHERPAPVRVAKRVRADQRRAPVPITKRASTNRRPAPVPLARHANARQPPVAGRQARAASRPAAVHDIAAARVHAPVGQAPQSVAQAPWEVMHVSLARCSGDLIARIACDQRVRRHFCAGRWGEAPECAIAVAYEHGQ